MSRTMDIEGRLREAAEKEMEKRADEASRVFQEALVGARCGAAASEQRYHDIFPNRVSIRVAGDGTKTASSYWSHMLLEAVRMWKLDNQAKVGDKAIEDFLAKVDRLAAEVEEIRWAAEMERSR